MKFAHLSEASPPSKTLTVTTDSGSVLMEICCYSRSTIAGRGCVFLSIGRVYAGIGLSPYWGWCFAKWSVRVPYGFIRIFDPSNPLDFREVK